MDAIDAIAVLEKLRHSEINFGIQHFYDAGYTFALGDKMNGFLDEMDFDTFEEGVHWLWQTAEKHFPEADCFE